MKNLYLYINLGSFIVPFLFSFHPKLNFYKKWKYFFPAVAVMMAFFIPWDIVFTNNGFWGFDDRYITGYKILNLPIEEWLFFICIPYACLFTYYSLDYLTPKFKLSLNTTNKVYTFLVSLLIILLWYHYTKWYTFINFSYAIILLGLVFNKQKQQLADFLPSFLVILIPFFIVNGILTGTGIEDQVVWYDNTQNMGIRMFTIPIEDTIYALTMLLTVFVVMQWLESRASSKKHQ